MKFIFLTLIVISQLFSSVIKSPILSVDLEANKATIKVDKVDVGMSGFIYHKISPKHGSVLKNVVVRNFDINSKIATLELSDFNLLNSNALPDGKWKVQKGDEVILAFGYTRGLLIAPTEEIYYRISKNTRIQWVHPDIFATILSFNSHPTPTLEDFSKMSIATSTGLVFIYLDNRVYTLDARSFSILNISHVALNQDPKELKLPFYTRVPEIETSWFAWGEGTSEMDDYETRYYELMIQANPKNKRLYNIVKNGDEKLHHLLSEFALRERR